MASYGQVGKFCPMCKKLRKRKFCEVCGTKTDGVGKWYTIIDLPKEEGQKRNQKKLSGFESKRDAKIAGAAYEAEYSKKKKLALSADIFGTVFNRYLAYQETRVTESTYIDTNNCFSLHILPMFGNRVIHAVTSKDIIEWQTYMNDREYSFKYKDKLLGFIKSFFNYCIEIEEILTDNPVKKKLKFKDDKVKKKKLFYTLEEYTQFRNVITSLEDKVLFDMLFFTGMRKGELIALLWQDLKDNELSITKTYTRKTKDRSWKITPPKSPNSIRSILLPQFLLDEINKLRINKQALGTDYIFGDQTPTNERRLDLARNKYVKLSHAKRIRIHDFRHSHVSYLISENIDLMTISRRIGDTVQTILNTYAHLMPSKQTELIDKMQTLVTKL